MRSAAQKNPPAGRITGAETYAIAFGLFLGLAIVKFGNPVILEKILEPPKSWSDALHGPWPLEWANWLLGVLALIGLPLAFQKRRWPASRWLWILPMVWFAWQVLSATQSPHHDLTRLTLWQYAGCAVCYFIGVFVIGPGRGWKFVFLGLIAAFAFCLVRAVDQKLIEYPSERQYFIQNQREGWTNMPPEVFQEFKHQNIIITTNGVDIANPLIMQKYAKGRVSGTLVYPNALAGVVLLLLPAAIVLVLQSTRNLRRLTCIVAVALTTFLGVGGLFWSGSKAGWLIALAIGVFWLCRLKWSRRLKWLMVIAVLGGGLIIFGLRFETYFAKGATSVGARFDYWRVAAHVAATQPAFGTGPGTFQRPYAELKRPDAEMARLVHNDYLEQFSDSGIIGGISYAAWLGLLLWTLGRRTWENGGWLEFGIFAGLLGWFTQGLTEFSLFIPALAWTAFTLAGCLLRQSANQVDKPKPGV